MSVSRVTWRSLLTVVMAAGSIACDGSEGDLVEAVEPELAVFPVWERVQLDQVRGLELADLWAREDGGEAWAAGSGGVILHYTAGSWHADSVPRLPRIRWSSVAFSSDGTRGFVVGSEGKIAQYAGNHHWELRTESLGTESLNSVWLDPSGLEGYAVGGRTLVLRWVDQRWRRVTTSHFSGQTRLLDVAANGREVWIRDSLRVTAFTGEDLRAPFVLQGFGASELWAQGGAKMWVGGVSYVPGRLPRGKNRFSIRSFDAGHVDSVIGIPFMPRAAWMAKDARIGIVAGRFPRGEEDLFRTAYITPGGVYQWDNPDSADIRAVWVNQAGSEGWGVGSGGFVGRLRFRKLGIRGIQTTYGSLNKLTGRHSLDLEPGAPRPALESLQLVTDVDTIRLLQGVHFRVDSVQAEQLAFRITDAGRKRAKRLASNAVKLRLVLSYPLATSPYPVVFEKSSPLTLDDKSLLERIRWYYALLASAPVLVFLALWGATQWNWVRSLLFAPMAQQALAQGRGNYIRAWAGYAFLTWGRLRRKLFQRYRRRLKLEQGSLAYSSPPSLELLKCDGLSHAAVNADRRIRWRLIFQDMLKKKKAVIWVQDADGSQGSDLLSRWRGVALDRDETPVLVRLTDRRPIADQIRGEWNRVDDIPKGVPPMWEAGGFVLLLDGSGGDADKAATDVFIHEVRYHNLVVICRPTPPDLPDVCYVRLEPAA
jgi:hypothetical protein